MKQMSRFASALSVGTILLTSTLARTRTATSKPFHTIQQQAPGWFQDISYASANQLETEYTRNPSDCGQNDDEASNTNGDPNDNAQDDKEEAIILQESPSVDETEESMSVGVKSHSKKSNAVGDPDGEGSDDDDSDSEEAAAWEAQQQQQMMDLVGSPVQVELELVEDEGVSMTMEQQDMDEENSFGSAGADAPSSQGGGGVGVRFGRLANRRRNKNKAAQKDDDYVKQSSQAILQAWQPFVYFPPSAPALDYLSEHSRQLESAAKSRLDRRTLYSGLLIEWLPHLTSSSQSGHRKFMEPSTSQALQAALSMACQPQWRKTWPRHNAIRLYDTDANSAKACTLAMQESIATALVS